MSKNENIFLPRRMKQRKLEEEERRKELLDQLNDLGFNKDKVVFSKGNVYYKMFDDEDLQLFNIKIE